MPYHNFPTFKGFLRSRHQLPSPYPEHALDLKFQADTDWAALEPVQDQDDVVV